MVRGKQLKEKISYSIIRYSADVVKNETVNVGLALYNYSTREQKYFILNENSKKLKSIFTNKAEIEDYKNDKEILIFYLQEYLLGNVMDKYYQFFKDKRINLSKPIIVFTKNQEELFKNILNKYI